MLGLLMQSILSHHICLSCDAPSSLLFLISGGLLLRTRHIAA